MTIHAARNPSLECFLRDGHCYAATGRRRSTRESRSQFHAAYAPAPVGLEACGVSAQSRPEFPHHRPAKGACMSALGEIEWEQSVSEYYAAQEFRQAVGRPLLGRELPVRRWSQFGRFRASALPGAAVQRRRTPAQFSCWSSRINLRNKLPRCASRGLDFVTFTTGVASLNTPARLLVTA
jgi:hypothetical protein